MPTYLHQLIAVQRGVEADTKRQLDEIRRVIAVGGDRDPLTGLSRTHKSRNPEVWPDKPAQSRRVQMTAADLLAAAKKASAKLFDVKFTREAGNCEARADIIVDGTTLMENVPVGYLLFLEDQLTVLITTLIDRLPVLNPAEEWHDHTTDPGLPRGVWASAPRQTESTDKLPQVQELSPAQVIDGKAFDPQVRWFDADQVTGKWTVVQYSGQLPAAAVQEFRERAQKVLEAVRRAREQANRLEVAETPASADLLGYVFGNLVP